LKYFTILRIFIIFLCISCSLNAQFKKSYDPQNGVFNFTSKVKSCKETEFRFQIKNGDTIKIPRHKTPMEFDFQATFDSSGKITQQIYYRSDRVNRTRKYEYDHKGNLIYYSSNKQLNDSTWYIFLQKSIYDQNNLESKTIHETTDSSGKTKLSKTTLTTTIIYDSLLRIKEKLYTDKKGTEKEIFKYNTKGDRISETYFSINKKVKSHTTYLYDDNHRCTEESPSKNIKYTYKYNNNGRVVEESRYENGKQKYRYVYKRDQFDNKIEEECFKNGKASYILLLKYDYDEKGNWMKRRYIWNGDLIFITERSFEYY
jgi:YD repeat-containing protein